LNNGEICLQEAFGVIEEILSGGGEFRMYPKGTSMLPIIVQGRDSVVLMRNTETPAKKHDIAFYLRKNGQFVLHRVMKIEKDGSYTMCGDNQTVLEKGIEKEQIIGYVSRLYKGEKERNMRSISYRLYIFFYCFMPLRKVIRFPKRAIMAIYRRVFRRNKV
jgi:hypothetical protein